MARGTAFLAVAIVMGLAATQAAAQCHTSEEILAEQVERFRTALMVASVNCQPQWPDRDLRGLYQTFKARHHDRLAEAQSVLINRFSRQPSADPVETFDAFATRLANEESLAMSPVRCANHYTPALLATAAQTRPNDFAKYAAHLARIARPRYAVCPGAV